MPSITQLREEIEAKRTNLHNIFAAYDDVTKIPADEAKKIKPMNDELTQLSKDLEAAEELNGIKASVVSAAFRGAEIHYVLRLSDGEEVSALFPSHHQHHIGEQVRVRLDLEHVVAFAAT